MFLNINNYDSAYREINKGFCVKDFIHFSGGWKQPSIFLHRFLTGFLSLVQGMNQWDGSGLTYCVAVSDGGS